MQDQSSANYRQDEDPALSSQILVPGGWRNVGGLECSSVEMMTLSNIFRFFWNTFLKRHDATDSSTGQQAALESFYKGQAEAYDSTRKYLLLGRERMLEMASKQLKIRHDNGRLPRPKPIWIDIGGGTGANIEAMSRYLDVPEFFKTVYLIDLSPSLLTVAEQRFSRLGWENIKLICEDARNVRMGDADARSEDEIDVRYTEKADLITMSYSLTMIPDFFPVVDLLPSFLSPIGIIAVVDFYVQNMVDVGDRNYIGDRRNRHVNYFSRVFWRAWFDVDRVNLELARRDYLEYKFGTVSCVNLRNYYLGIIPYYIWIGCPKELPFDESKPSSKDDRMEQIKAITTKILPSTKETSSCLTKRRDDLVETAVHNLEAGLPLPSVFYHAERGAFSISDNRAMDVSSSWSIRPTDPVFKST